MKLARNSVLAAAVLLIAIAVGLVLFSRPQSRPKVSPEKFRETKAATLVMTVAFAIRDFKNEYGRLPGQINSSDQFEQKNITLVEVLCADTNSPVARVLNPKGILFLPDFFQTENRELADAWGSEVNVILAAKPGGPVEVGSKLIPTGFAVWSNGPNGRNEHGEGDDIASWKLDYKRLPID